MDSRFHGNDGTHRATFMVMTDKRAVARGLVLRSLAQAIYAIVSN